MLTMQQAEPYSPGISNDYIKKFIGEYLLETGHLLEFTNRVLQLLNSDEIPQKLETFNDETLS